MTVGPSHQLNTPLDLGRGIDALGLRVTEAQQHQLLGYMDLIQKWNKVYNLTALRNPQEILTHHVLDSLSVIAPLLRHLEKKMVPHKRT
jgi:16S rRNA (guanine527-N7)-methyltransferase